MKFVDSIYHDILKAELARIPNGVEDLTFHCDQSLRFIQAIPRAKLAFAYAPGKWTVAQVVGHLLDTRIVFLNRILYVARGEKIALPNFDEQIWVANGGYSRLGLDELTSIYSDGARLFQSMINALPPGSLGREGVANGVTITVEEIVLYLMAHEMHHLNVIAERYLDRSPDPA
jgi:uncharacterized damage-inducible protein DinB